MHPCIDVFVSRKRILFVPFSTCSLRCVFEEPRAAQRAYDSLPSLFTTVCCHYDQASVCIPASDAFLAVPESDRLFLISPPFSPPVDWKPIVEGPPVVNHDLVARLQALSTQSDGGDASAQHAPCAGDTTVLHPSTAPTMPAIVLHFAGDDPDAPVGVAGMSVAGVRTAFPPRL